MGWEVVLAVILALIIVSVYLLVTRLSVMQIQRINTSEYYYVGGG